MAEHSKYPFFADNIQFWYETKRAFGASSYGASEFGEVMATVSRITTGSPAWNPQAMLAEVTRVSSSASLAGR